MLIRPFASLLLVGSVCVGQSVPSPSFSSSANISSALDTGSAPTSVPKKPVSFDLNSIDKMADPCTDFYQYSCGNWVRSNPIPAGQVRWGRFNELAERSNYLLYQELKAASESPKAPLQRSIETILEGVWAWLLLTGWVRSLSSRS